MKPKIIVFGASNSKNSINRALATYAASCINDIDYQILDLNDYEMPIYSVDKNATGIPNEAHRFNTLLEEADGFIIGIAEHNGMFTAAFKNIFDWISRIDKNVFKNKPVLLVATSPGERGAKGVLEAANTIFPFFGADIKGSFSLPNFNTNFEDNSITNKILSDKFQQEIQNFKQSVTI